jgi:hypothetical protein
MRTRNEEDICCREWRIRWKQYGNVARGIGGKEQQHGSKEEEPKFHKEDILARWFGKNRKESGAEEEERGRYNMVWKERDWRRKTGEGKERGQRTEDREEGLEKQIKRNGANTGRCEEDEEEGGRLEKKRREDREKRIGRND